MSAANFSRNLAFCVIFWGGNRMQNHMATWLEEIGLWVCAVVQFARNQIELWTSPDDPPYTLKHEEFSAGCLASCGLGAEWMHPLKGILDRMLRLDVRDLIAVAVYGSCTEAKWSSRSHTKSANVTFADWIPNAKCLKPSCFTCLDDPSNCSEEKHGQDCHRCHIPL